MPNVTPNEENEEIERVECQCCHGNVPSNEVSETRDGTICADCVEEHYYICQNCDEMVHSEDVYTVSDGIRARNYCQSCYDDLGCFHCNDCGGGFTRDNEAGESGYCRDCSRDDDDEDEDEEGSGLSYSPNLKDETLISNKKGKVITSPRMFGIELECLYTKTDSKKKLAEVISKSWGYSNDGSIRSSKNSIGNLELISPRMAGIAGEKEIEKLGSVAYKAGLFVNDSCGYHLHLHAPEFKRPKDDDKKERAKIGTLYIRNAVGNIMNRISDVPVGLTEREISSAVGPIPDGWRCEIVEDEEQPLPSQKGIEFNRLRDLWYTYLIFDDVFRGMIPSGRRTNTFCKASSSIYSLDEVRDLRDWEELEVLWYKIDRRKKKDRQLAEAQNRKMGKDSSRYTGFNLEPLLRMNGSTIEFRYHSPTLNSEKIIRWIDIHQTILDRIAQAPLDEAMAYRILSTETHLIRKAIIMCKMFGIKKETQEYIVERLHKFNKLNDSDTRDEEIDPSPIGQPAQRSSFPMMSREPNTPARGEHITARSDDAFNSVYAYFVDGSNEVDTQETL
jgi:hypothetical protein